MIPTPDDLLMAILETDVPDFAVITFMSGTIDDDGEVSGLTPTAAVELLHKAVAHDQEAARWHPCDAHLVRIYRRHARLCTEPIAAIQRNGSAS
jgi:hypothetical protein